MNFKPVVVVVLTVFLLACGDDIATVNGRGVSQAEFDAYLKYKRIAVRDKQQEQRVLDQYLEREALASLIEEEELLDDNGTLQAELDDVRREILISRYFEKFLNEQVSEQAVSNYYNTNAANYEEKKVHVAHILLRTNRTMDEAQRKVKLTTAQEAYSKIKGGMKFDAAAKKYSEDDVSGKKGGDLGWVKQGIIDQAFSERAFSLKPGEVSEPFETPFGFHVLTVLEEPQVIKRPFDAVKGEIRYQLRNEHKDAEIKRLLTEIDIDKD
jgi:peptidyl-prolyl cis-trans isomerase C